MDLPQLRTVLRVAQSGSFSQAARDQGLTQPAVSQQIARLEAELGRAIFERRGRRVLLTEAGEIVRQRAEAIVALADETPRVVNDGSEAGRLTISAIPTIAPYLVPRLVTLFRKKHPGMRLEIHEEVTASLINRCAAGEIDLGLLALPVERQELAVEKLFEEDLWLVLPRKHPLARRATVRLTDLENEPFVLLDEAHCLSGDVQAFCRGRRFQPLTTGRTAQLATVLELVSLGHGVSFIPDMARKLDRSETRVYRKMEAPRPMRTIGACWNPARYQSRFSKSCLDLLRSHIGVR